MFGYVKLADTITVGVANHRFDTGVTADPTATSCKIFLNGSTTALAYSPTPADCGLGLSITTLTFSGANGFSVGNYGSVFILATQADGVLSAVGRFDFVITTRSIEDLAFPQTPGRGTLVAADGSVSPNWADVKSPATTVGLSGTTVGVLTTYTGNTPQTGDNFARLGAPVGASVSADIASVKADDTTLLGRLTALRAGYLDNLSAGAFATASALATAQTAITNIQARLPTSLVGGRIDASIGAMANDVLTAAATATDFGTEVATAVWDFVLEGTDKAKELARGWTSALINLASGFNTSTRKYRDRGNTKDRITATVDATGRTAVVTDLT